MKVNKLWLKSLNSDEKLEMKRVLADAGPALARLVELLEDSLEESLVQMASKSNYDAGAFSEKTADRLGEQRTYRRVIELITFEE